MVRRLALVSACLSLVALLSAGCRTRDADPTRPQVIRAGQAWRSDRLDLNADEEQQVEAFARYAAGVVDELDDAPEDALAHYLAAVAADPADEDLTLEVSRKLIERRRLEDARQLLERSTKRPQASASVWTWLGTVLALQGNPEAAMAAHREAVRRTPTDFVPYQNLIQLHLEADRVDQALAILREAESQPDTDSVFLLTLANVYEALRRTRNPKVPDLRPTIVGVLDRVRAMSPESPMERLRLADLYQLAGEGDRALPLYQDLLKSDPDLPGLRERLTEIYLRADNREKATEQLQHLSLSHPSNAWPHYFLGLLALEDRRFDDAVAAFNRVLVLRPDNDAIYYDLAIAQLSHRRPADALEVLTRARQRFRPTFQLEFYTAAALSDLERYAEAIRHYTTAEVIASATAPVRLTALFHFQFGIALERNKQYAEAATKFERAIELKPDFADALNYLGYMWAERGENLERARDMIQKAVDLEPDNGAFLDSLAWVLHQLGRSAEALPHQLRAIELSKEPDPVLFDHLGDIYRRLERVEDARAAWRKALEGGSNTAIEEKLNGPTN